MKNKTHKQTTPCPPLGLKIRALALVLFLFLGGMQSPGPWDVNNLDFKNYCHNSQTAILLWLIRV
jgi:hypothetical protein